MYDKEVEPFSNPLAPPSAQPVGDRRHDHNNRESSSAAMAAPQDTQPLTNADFRKLMMTPRVGGLGGGGQSSMGSASVRESTRGQRPALKSDATDNRKTKKKFYATLKRQEDDTLSELAKRYRDRARERRDGDNPDYTHETSESSVATNAAYRAVAPDVKSGLDAAERRKKVIQESKYLGGDMEHTHLVKGLDYALLHKVKAEITHKETEADEDDDEEEEREANEAKGANKKAVPVDDDVVEEPDDPFAVKSKIAKNIVNIVINRALPERNELFLTGRMAYVVDLEDEFPDSDIPTTVIRSKADCPNIESMTSLSTNDIVINKLTQILSYLRQGGAGRKTKKAKDKIPFIDDNKTKKSDKLTQNANKSTKGDSIYDDIGEYVPDLKKKESRNDRERDKSRDHRDRDHRNRDRDRERDRNRDKRSRNYFEKSGREEQQESRKTETRDAKSIVLAGITGTGAAAAGVQLRTKSTHRLDQEMPESYAECYPGAPENDDAVLDSDDEVDYSKMDLGNKKGVIGRWDFDTAEEYGDYMSHKEALPKAAFQYGVKMADGRKTRRVAGKKDEKIKLDRDLQKINAILARRKGAAGDASGGGSGGDAFGATPAPD
ncbi:unnamed protein product, partial [Medioppia subpectinata]